MGRVAPFPQPALYRVDRALPCADAMLRRCRECLAVGDLDGAWRAMARAAWRVTAGGAGPTRLASSPRGTMVWQRPEPSAHAELRHRDPREGPLRRREVALAALLAASRAARPCWS